MHPRGVRVTTDKSAAIATDNDLQGLILSGDGVGVTIRKL